MAKGMSMTLVRFQQKMANMAGYVLADAAKDIAAVRVHPTEQQVKAAGGRIFSLR